jgi:ParB-like chromosome segregation protein Spo0J
MTDTTTEPRPRLLPEAPPRATMRPIRLAALPADEALPGPPPDRGLRESVAALGVLQPVLLEAGRDGAYRVRDGRRRVKAARAAGLEAVPALVVGPEDGADGAPWGDALTLAAHATRRDNLAAELGALERLVAAGADAGEIARATGWAPNTTRQRLRLLGLHPALRAALAAGALTRQAALAAARLPAGTQARLAAVLAAEGRLTERHLAEARRARVAAASAALPFAALAATPSADELEPAPPAPDGPAPPVAGSGVQADPLLALVAAASAALDLLRAQPAPEAPGVADRLERALASCRHAAAGSHPARGVPAPGVAPAA